MNRSSSTAAASINTKQFDVLSVYDDLTSVQSQSILTGGLDTGIDFGKFLIDTSNNIGPGQHQKMEMCSERFIGPYARTELNSPSLLNPDNQTNPDDDEALTSEAQSNYLMTQYFKLINTQMHGIPGGKVESESFSQDFRLPKCYEIPKTKLKDIASLSTDKDLLLASNSDSQSMYQLTQESRCKQFPEKVLFYIFYNMPHDKAQLNAYIELQSRGWFYLQQKMLWIKPNKDSQSTTKKDTKKKGGRARKDSDSNRTAIVFNA